MELGRKQYKTNVQTGESMEWETGIYFDYRTQYVFLHYANRIGYVTVQDGRGDILYTANCHEDVETCRAALKHAVNTFTCPSPEMRVIINKFLSL